MRTVSPGVASLLLSVHAASVWFCTGLVWIVQLLVYPGFAAVGVGPPDRWRSFHERHTRLMGYVVVGPWAVQGLTCLVLLVDRPPGAPWVLVLAAAVCGLVTVVVTVAVSVPCHQRLSQGFDPDVHARLVRTNRWRTTAWTLGGLVAVVLVVAAAP